MDGQLVAGREMRRRNSAARKKAAGHLSTRPYTAAPDAAAPAPVRSTALIRFVFASAAQLVSSSVATLPLTPPTRVPARPATPRRVGCAHPTERKKETQWQDA